MDRARLIPFWNQIVAIVLPLSHSSSHPGLPRTELCLPALSRRWYNIYSAMLYTLACLVRTESFPLSGHLASFYSSIYSCRFSTWVQSLLTAVVVGAFPVFIFQEEARLPLVESVAPDPQRPSSLPVRGGAPMKRLFTSTWHHLPQWRLCHHFLKIIIRPRGKVLVRNLPTVNVPIVLFLLKSPCVLPFGIHTCCSMPLDLSARSCTLSHLCHSPSHSPPLCIDFSTYSNFSPVNHVACSNSYVKRRQEKYRKTLFNVQNSGPVV